MPVVRTRTRPTALELQAVTVLVWLLLGGMACLLLGAVIGYSFCAQVSGRVFQALVDGGLLIAKTEDGWQGQASAFNEVLLKVKKE